LYTPPVTPRKLATPEAGEDLSKVGSAIGVKS
jgi:hypothetical protein